MVWCTNCSRDCQTGRDHASGYICCSECGRILYQDLFTEEPTFVKGPGGASRLAGSFVKSIQNDCSDSFRRTLENGNRQINDLMVKLQISDGSLEREATSFYKIAVERSFTRGRRTGHVAAACLYIACRANNKPYLLIDFAMWLSVNVYVLGAVYLQLCKLLSLEEHAFVQKPADPSLFMHRFTNALVKDDYNKKVLRTALKIVSSMKRDWMQTGRKPSGICGAALYISSLSHGFSYAKSDVVKIVHICEATLTKRLVEFENTESGSLTIEEFEKNAEEYEKDNPSSTAPDANSRDSEKMEVLCQHKGKEPHFAHGLCRDCYKDFVELSGGLNGGSDPPAFQHAEMDRLARSSAQKEGDPDNVANQEISSNQEETMPEFASPSATGNADKSCENTGTIDDDIPSASDETDNLSDIDDVEVNCYLNSEKESQYKKIIWEEMNKEYLQEQAAKEAAAAASSYFDDASGDVLAAKKLAAAAAAAVAKSRENRRQKRALEARHAGPAATAAEAARQMLSKKRLSSKINYDVLDELFNDTMSPSNKKIHTDSETHFSADEQRGEEDANEAERSIFNEPVEKGGYMKDSTAKDLKNDEFNGYEDGEEMFYYDDADQDNFDDY